MRRSASAFEYVRDDAARCIRITVHRTLSLDEALALIDRQVAEGAWTFGVLCDIRSLRVPPAKADIDAIAAHVFRYLITTGPRGPVAFVTSCPNMVGPFQGYSYIVGRADANTQVFWDLHEADAWLSHQLR